nr:hypothetical protein [Escherichia coli]
MPLLSIFWDAIIYILSIQCFFGLIKDVIINLWLAISIHIC